MPTETADSTLWSQIRTGYNAEMTFVRRFRAQVVKVASNTYKIAKSDLRTLVRRTLKAAINTIRKHNWYPNLIRHMVQGQVLVLRWQQEKIRYDDMQRLEKILTRFVLRRMGSVTSGGLTVRQEDLCIRAFDIFREKVSRKDFVLTSTLDTYLIGIAIRLIKSSGEPKTPNRPAKTRILAAPEDNMLLEQVRFYQRSHQLVAQELGQLGSTCRQIILQHYGIDPDRISQVDEFSEPDEPMSHEEFDALFRVSGEQNGPPRKLKDIAEDLGISPKKISTRHTACLDQLVQRVLPALLNDPSSAYSQKVRKEMESRLALAQKRRQK